MELAKPAMKLQKNTSARALQRPRVRGRSRRATVSAAEIAQKYGVSSHHLAKVLAELARAGVVESARGVGGGYRFAGNARRLTLMDVIRLFEDFGPAEPDRREPGERMPLAGRWVSCSPKSTRSRRRR